MIADKKSPNLKLRAMIIIASAIFSYVIIILGLGYFNSHDPEKWLIASAYYDPELESLAVNYQDIQHHTAKVTVSLETVSGDLFELGEFAENQQALLSKYTVDGLTPSLPQSVTFTILLQDGSIVSKTIDVQVINIQEQSDAVVATTSKT